VPNNISTSGTKLLVIVDMQKFYKGKEPRGYVSALRNILREIEKAQKNAWQIVVVEYNPGWANRIIPTHPDIIEKVGREFIKVKKGVDDGSPLVIRAIKRRKINPIEIAVCGMVTQCCVLYMVKGLRRKYGKEVVRVVEDAVFGNGPWHEYLIDDVDLQYHDPRRKP
jgi:nicotinamidase-related amidase